MDTWTVKLFAKYTAHTNEEMNKLIRSLSQEQWDHQFGGFFPSIHALCNHLYVSDFLWLKRFSQLREFTYSRHDLFKQTFAFNATAIGTLDDYLEKRETMDTYITEFINEVTQEDLEKQFTYTDAKGNTYTRIFGGLILHMFNHETHHRGMIALYLDELGIQNDFSSFAAIL